MNKLVFCFCLILFSTKIISQENRFINESKTYVIELSSSKKIKKIGVNCSEVIDKRENKSNIGKIFKGITDKKYEAIFTGDFSEYLEIKLHSILEQKENNHDLIFIVHKLQINEEKNGGQKIGYCELEIEFGYRESSNIYSYGIYESEIIETAVDVNGTHGRRIIKALKKCLTTFNSTNWKNRKGFLIDIEAEKYRFNYESVPKRGVYYSYGQLARNKPVQEVKFEIIPINPKSKYVKYTCRSQLGNFGDIIKYISDGTSIYIHVGNNLDENVYIKSKQFGKYIYFENKYSDPIGGVLFGLIGTIVFRKGAAFIIDTKLNKIKIFDEYTVLELTNKRYPEILKEFKNSRRKLPDLERALIKINEKY